MSRELSRGYGMMSSLNEVLLLPLLHLLSSCSLWGAPPSPKILQKDSKTSIEIGKGYVEQVVRDCIQREGFSYESAEMNKYFN